MNFVININSIVAFDKLTETLSHLVFLSPSPDVLISKGEILYFLCFYVAMIMQILVRQNQNLATECQSSLTRFKTLLP